MSTLVVGVVVFTVLILLLSLVVLRMRSWLLPSTGINLTINQQTPITVKSGRKLLEVLNDVDIAVPSACAGMGTCGLCKVAVTKGGGALLVTEASRLTLVDHRQHLRLACQVVVRNDISVEVPSHILNAASWQARVESVRSLSPLIREIIFTMPDGMSFDFKPGAYVQITAPAFKLSFADLSIDEKHRHIWQQLGIASLSASSREPITRAYSVANRPLETQQVVVLIRLALPPPAELQNVPPGIVSSWLFSLAVGDDVTLSGPFGEFGLQDNDREMVLIGGGVGMAPLRSIIHHELHGSRTRAVTFFYGARSQTDLFYQKEFNELQQDHHRFKRHIALSDPDLALPWDGPTGFIHQVFKAEFLDHHPHPERCDYYLCGPPLMQKAVLAVLDDEGVDTSHVFADVFGD